MRRELRWRKIVVWTVRTLLVVVNPPFLDDFPRFSDIGKPMLIQVFITELSIEAFNISILLWQAQSHGFLLKANRGRDADDSAVENPFAAARKGIFIMV